MSLIILIGLLMVTSLMKETQTLFKPINKMIDYNKANNLNRINNEIIETKPNEDKYITSSCRESDYSNYFEGIENVVRRPVGFAKMNRYNIISTGMKKKSNNVFSNINFRQSTSSTSLINTEDYMSNTFKTVYDPTEWFNHLNFPKATSTYVNEENTNTIENNMVHKTISHLTPPVNNLINNDIFTEHNTKEKNRKLKFESTKNGNDIKENTTMQNFINKNILDTINQMKDTIKEMKSQPLKFSKFNNTNDEIEIPFNLDNSEQKTNVPMISSNKCAQEVHCVPINIKYYNKSKNVLNKSDDESQYLLLNLDFSNSSKNILNGNDKEMQYISKDINNHHKSEILSDTIDESQQYNPETLSDTTSESIAENNDEETLYVSITIKYFTTSASISNVSEENEHNVKNKLNNFAPWESISNDSAKEEQYIPINLHNIHTLNKSEEYIKNKLNNYAPWNSISNNSAKEEQYFPINLHNAYTFKTILNKSEEEEQYIKNKLNNYATIKSQLNNKSDAEQYIPTNLNNNNLPNGVFKNSSAFNSLSRENQKYEKMNASNSSGYNLYIPYLNNNSQPLPNYEKEKYAIERLKQYNYPPSKQELINRMQLNNRFNEYLLYLQQLNNSKINDSNQRGKYALRIPTELMKRMEFIERSFLNYPTQFFFYQPKREPLILKERNNSNKEISRQWL